MYRGDDMSIKTLNLDDPELIEALESIRNVCIEIPESLGRKPNIPNFIYEMVMTENRFIIKYEYAKRLGNLAADWKITKNPHYIDLAMLLCNKAGVALTPTLQDCAADAAKLRLSGGETGTHERIEIDYAKQHTLMFMMNCLYKKKYSMEVSASKAIIFHKAAYPKLKPYTSLTLQRYYRNEMRKKNKYGLSIEDEYFKSWSNFEKIDKNYKKETEKFIQSVD